ncbi:MAG: helix-turn-helix transcriptional regulator [Oceanospirillales bacterium]|uniref:Helix-turn-helix protein n=1 Tax=Marinobacterium halophilum TaxID=267374 RepID=A0A2P8EQQ6_9GAMM|nr:AraC family transcriptional regulator [Marinobacterium halophilum]MBR9827696.1 helix-turn-helix transcriptional regulator [Oceanospirillales bacterium]PSL11806.1 helix-turn-helix protein [Marinobacterium halophilum]
MNKNKDNFEHLNSDQRALWDFEAQDFPLPDGGGMGRIQRFDFNDVLRLYRSEFRVQRDCVIDTSAGESELPNLLCSVLLLSGEMLLETPDGKQYEITPQSGIVYRVRDNGTRFLMKGGQTLRHIGVAGKISGLHKQLGETLPGALACFSSFPESGVVSREVPVNTRLRSLLANVFAPGTCASDPLQEIALEGVSMSILAELARTILAGDTECEDRASLWGEQIFSNLTTYIRSNLDAPLKADDICQRFGITRRQLSQLFLVSAQCTPREFLRRERLERARELIEQESVPVKLVAAAVGYSHVSNFSKAYRDYFGETPGHTLRMSAINTSSDE